MNKSIDTIFIDVGNTLRILVEDEPYQAAARKKIADFVGTDEHPDSFCKMLDVRYKVYRKWAFSTLREAPEHDLWTKWMLPDYPYERIAPLAGELTFLYRQTMGRRYAAADAKTITLELTRRGYKLGIISNTITEREIPNWLVEDGLDKYYPTVVLSSIYGYRKPGPEIYLEAASRAGSLPENCAYVGDNITRDVEGSHKAGFGMVLIMLSPDEVKATDPELLAGPDAIIQSLSDLLDIFPALETAPETTTQP